jgi:hypothetical protein
MSKQSATSTAPRGALAFASILLALLGVVGPGLNHNAAAGRVCPSNYIQDCAMIHIYYYGRLGFDTEGDPCGHLGEWWWPYLTISASSLDPFVNEGPITDDTLYLWVYGARYGYGFSFGETHFYGDLDVVAYDPVPPADGGLYWPNWAWWAPLDYPDCQGLQLIGKLTVQMPVAVEGESWGRIKSMYR